MLGLERLLDVALPVPRLLLLRGGRRRGGGRDRRQPVQHLPDVKFPHGSRRRRSPLRWPRRSRRRRPPRRRQTSPRREGGGAGAAALLLSRPRGGRRAQTLVRQRGAAPHRGTEAGAKQIRARQPAAPPARPSAPPRLTWWRPRPPLSPVPTCVRVCVCMCVRAVRAVRVPAPSRRSLVPLPSARVPSASSELRVPPASHRRDAAGGRPHNHHHRRRHRRPPPPPPHPSRARPPCLTTRKRSAPGRSGGGSSSQPDSGGAAAHARREGRHPDVAMRDLPRSAAERGADGAAERCERVESGTSVSAGTRKDADTVLRSRLLALPGRVRAQQQLPGVAPRWRTGVRVVLPIFRFAFSIRVHFSVICSVVP